MHQLSKVKPKAIANLRQTCGGEHPPDRVASAKHCIAFFANMAA